jgi:hypothetical protein
MKNQAFASYSFVGRKHTAELITKMSASLLGKTQKTSTTVTCPHCLRVGAARGMGWHFDKCKFKPILLSRAQGSQRLARQA